MFAWNPLINIGFLFLIILKPTLMCALHIPNEVALNVQIKPYYSFAQYIATIPGITELSATLFCYKIWENQETAQPQKSDYRHSTHDDGLYLSHCL